MIEKRNVTTYDPDEDGNADARIEDLEKKLEGLTDSILMLAADVAAVGADDAAEAEGAIRAYFKGTDALILEQRSEITNLRAMLHEIATKAAYAAAYNERSPKK